MSRIAYTIGSWLTITGNNWRLDYNSERPHKSLGYLSPITYADQHSKRSEAAMMLYPQTANGNNSKIEESR